MIHYNRSILLKRFVMFRALMIFSMLFSFSIVPNVANAKAQLKVYCINKHGKKRFHGKRFLILKK